MIFPMILLLANQTTTAIVEVKSPFLNKVLSPMIAILATAIPLITNLEMDAAILLELATSM